MSSDWIERLDDEYEGRATELQVEMEPVDEML